MSHKVNLHPKPLTHWLMLLVFVGIVGALIGLGVSTYKFLREVDQDLNRFRRSHEVLSEVAVIRESTFSIESMARGFVISGDRAVLAQQALTEQKRAAALEHLKSLSQDSASQKTRIDGLSTLLQECQDQVSQTIATRETQGFEAARLLVMNLEHSGVRARYQNQMTQIQDEEQRLLSLGGDARDVANGRAAQMYIFVLAAMGGLLGLVFVSGLRQIRSRAEQIELELGNHALAVEKKAAEQTAQAKEQFLATMSHEIRTPMSSLLGLLELLGHSPLNQDQSEMLDIARDSGRSMVHIIDDILDHSKIQAGKLQIVLEPVSIGYLLTCVCSKYATRASRKGLELSYTLDPRINAGLMADPHRLMQVLGNLVSNAIKFTSQGFVELRADFIDRTAGVETIRLSVKDTGIGMTPEMQMRLAKPFEQVGANTSGLYGGIGLGMVISRRLTEMMGGELQVQSAPQEGTTFSATFKLALSEAVPVEQMHTSSRTSLTSSIQMATPPLSDIAFEHQLPKTTVAPPKSTPWVLAVDDNQTNRILIQRQFSLLGLRVRTATDGDQALELWQNGDYALVLTDINMTERNGYELARAIRETEVAQGRPRTPVLGWTANTMSDTLARCKEAGMDDVLIKPADLVRLRELQMRWLPSVPVADDVAKVIEPVDSAFDVEVLDAKLLQESFGNDSSKLRQLLPTIQKTLNEQIAAMNVAIDDRDLAAIKVMSHNMRGSAGLIGANALMGVCARLEALVDRGGVSDLGQLTDQFRILAQRTVDVLNSMA